MEKLNYIIPIQIKFSMKERLKKVNIAERELHII